MSFLDSRDQSEDEITDAAQRALDGACLAVTQGHAQRAIAVYAAFVEAFLENENLTAVDAVRQAFQNWSLLLQRLGRRDEAVEVLERGVQAYRSCVDPGVREVLADLLVQLGVARAGVGVIKQGLADFDEALAYLGYTAESIRRDLVASVYRGAWEVAADAHVKKGIKLLNAGRLEEAQESFGQCLDFLGCPSVEVHVSVAAAMWNNALILGQQRRFAEQARALQIITSFYGKATDTNMVGIRDAAKSALPKARRKARHAWL